ncbi:Uncharacterised protein [Mycobacteroides abscessus subsp. abscessus]|nr:Uncharacterised protein [Mycobacteroides abscessus subsp. abscessus]
MCGQGGDRYGDNVAWTASRWRQIHRDIARCEHRDGVLPPRYPFSRTGPHTMDGEIIVVQCPVGTHDAVDQIHSRETRTELAGGARQYGGRIPEFGHPA